MRYNRNSWNRESAYNRQGGIHKNILLSGYVDTDSDAVARLQITQRFSGYADTRSDAHGALLLALAGRADSGCDAYGRLQLTNLLGGVVDTNSGAYARLQITQNLLCRPTQTGLTAWGKQQYNRAGYNRRFTRIVPKGYIGTISDAYGRLQLTNILIGRADTSSDAYGALFAVIRELAGYVDTETSAYGRLRIDSNMKGVAGSDSDAYGRLQLTNLLSGKADTDSSAFARLQIAHMIRAIAESISDAYGNLVEIETIVLTFSGTLEPGKTICIDGKTFSVLNDGVNAVGDFEGEYPAIFKGTNTVVYTDSEGSRTVTITVTKKDRDV